MAETADPMPGLAPPVDPIRAVHLSKRLTPCVAFTAVNVVGGIIGPTLVKHHPAVLLAIDSRNRHLLLTVAAGLTPISFFAIAFVRLVVSDPFFYLLGRDYGSRGLGWIERQTEGNTGYLGWINRWFGKASDLFLLVMPNTIVCMLAGMHGIPRRRVVVLDVIGTIGRLTLFWFTAKHFEDQLKEVLDFIQRYQWWLVVGLILVSLVQSTLQQRRTAASRLVADRPDPDDHRP